MCTFQISGLVEDACKLRNELQVKSEENQRLNEECQTLHHENCTLKESDHKQKEEYQRLNETHRRLNEQYDRLTEENHTLTAKNERLTEEHNRLQSEAAAGHVPDILRKERGKGREGGHHRRRVERVQSVDSSASPEHAGHAASGMGAKSVSSPELRRKSTSSPSDTRHKMVRPHNVPEVGVST